MKELVAISKSVIGDGEVNSVNARELHAFLEVGKDFSNWIKDRIEQYTFVENQDFILLANYGEQTCNAKRGGHNKTEYYISIDMAKELSMVERNDKGKQARQYFIRCEKALKEVVQLDNGNAITLKEMIDIKLMTTKYLSEMLNYSEASTLQLVHNVHKEHNISTLYLPQYVENQRICFSLTDLLKKNNIPMSTKALNSILIENGLLEEKERRSTSKGVKKFKALTPAGLRFGHNDVSPHNKNEVHPRYYEDTFLDMFNLVNPSCKAA